MERMPIKRLFLGLSMLGVQAVALGEPNLDRIAEGSATVTANQTVNGINVDTLIEQSSGKAILEWSNFDIDAGELVRFMQNGSDSVALNRISGDATQILGQLQANGRLFLVNPNGIVFGDSARVDVAGLVATTLDVANQDFLQGNYRFEGPAQPGAEIRNSGTIDIDDNGFVYLVAPDVDNRGAIRANLGRVGLATDGSFTLDLKGTELVSFQVTEEQLETSATQVSNAGSLVGDVVILQANEADKVMSSVVNSGNITAATAFDMVGGRVAQEGTLTAGDVALRASDSVLQSGDISATGRVDIDADVDIVMTQTAETRAGGDIRYNADDDLTVNTLTSENGYIGLIADNQFVQTGDITTRGTSVEVMAGTEAAGGPGSTGDIVMAEGARTQAVDDIRYQAGRDLTVGMLASRPDDDIELTAGRNLYQRADIVAAGSVTVEAGNDIVMARDSMTRAGSDIRYNADGNLTVASLDSDTGYIGLLADASIMQTGNISTGGSSVQVEAGTVAAGGPGVTGDVVMAEGTRTRATGDVRYTAGRDLILEALVSLPDDDVELQAGRDIHQHADLSAGGQIAVAAGNHLIVNEGIEARAGEGATFTAGNTMEQRAGSRIVAAKDISITAGRSVSMAGSALTRSEQGDIAYQAGRQLTVGHIMTSDRLDGGTVSLKAPAISGAAGGEGVQAGFIDIEASQTSATALERAIRSPYEVTRIVVNQREAGGRMTRDARFMNDLLLVPNGMTVAQRVPVPDADQ
ncbi:filamentous hemagglutinin N-terminal domain-containing protein [Modicisalibacter xianhensis]|uniref:Filamentous hemagglutinin family N-terminal domain-containing protein n=1 Tax=Modicisalibacter xianhensis TaxID=442341 RepID=A0A1I2ZFE9_9GAMM|nr:filamentous hemagglutinin N-terminal domain-containing protein [Halomonas xianhensis]SFH36440.1 filamentous hemagglutinin family N-terminal domain-containing protein [Halomonas xianhensis]